MTGPALRFGAGARRLCALAARGLGWRADQFWQATPEELACVLEPHGSADPGGIDRATLDALMEYDNAR